MNPFTDIPAQDLLGMLFIVYIFIAAVCLWFSMRP